VISVFRRSSCKLVAIHVVYILVLHALLAAFVLLLGREFVKKGERESNLELYYAHR
jgi:hypothetical protein